MLQAFFILNDLYSCFVLDPLRVKKAMIDLYNINKFLMIRGD